MKPTFLSYCKSAFHLLMSPMLQHVSYQLYHFTTVQWGWRAECLDNSMATMRRVHIPNDIAALIDFCVCVRARLKGRVFLHQAVLCFPAGGCSRCTRYSRVVQKGIPKERQMHKWKPGISWWDESKPVVGITCLFFFFSSKKSKNMKRERG